MAPTPLAGKRLNQVAGADAVEQELHGERREQHADYARDHRQAGDPEEPLDR